MLCSCTQKYTSNPVISTHPFSSSNDGRLTKQITVVRAIAYEQFLFPEGEKCIFTRRESLSFHNARNLFGIISSRQTHYK